MKIAVYFSGHLRNFQDNIPNYRRVFQAPGVTFDFYFTVWKLNHNTDNDSWEYNKKHKKTLVSTKSITEADIYAMFPEAKQVRILNEFALSKEYVHHKASTIFQLYSLYQAFQELPATYDLYVRCRPDLYFFDGIDWATLLNSSYDLFLPQNVWFSQKNFPVGDIFNDFFWVSTYAAGKSVSEIFLHIQTMTPDCAEKLFATYLCTKEFTICSYPFDVALERRTRGFDAPGIERETYTTRRLQEGDYV